MLPAKQITTPHFFITWADTPQLVRQRLPFKVGLQQYKSTFAVHWQGESQKQPCQRTASNKTSTTVFQLSNAIDRSTRSTTHNIRFGIIGANGINSNLIKLSTTVPARQYAIQQHQQTTTKQHQSTTVPA